MTTENPSYTIEPSMDRFAVYEWGIYECPSILAGRQHKAFRAAFKTVVEATAAYPTAYISEGPIDAGVVNGGCHKEISPPVYVSVSHPKGFLAEFERRL